MARSVQLDHHHFDRDPRDPNFNLAAARKAHAEVMARWDDPNEGDDFKALMLHTIQNATALEIERFRPQIQRFLNEWGKRQRQTLGKAIIKNYVRNAVEAAEEIRKAQWQEQYWQRKGGRFAGYRGPSAQRGLQRPPTTLTEAGPGGLPARGAEWGYGHAGESYHRHMEAQHQQAQQALLEHAARIAGASPRARQQVVWHLSDRKGNVRTVVNDGSTLPKVNRGETLVGDRGAGLEGQAGLTMHGQLFNLVQALGGGPQAAAAGGAVGDFAHGWDQATQTANAYGTNVGAGYARIKSGADALNTIAGPKAPMKVKAAIAIGRFVGDHGQDAERYLGPHARKTGYKYRGVERKPRDLPQRGEDDQQYHDQLVARIAGNIPTRSTHELNLASGYTSPSHGYIRNAKGDVIAEAQGTADDHYLPFKLSGLTRMKDGSYIRTRSTGGPTTQDIYAASVSGAKKFTVTSRQGTYEVGFDPEFTHQKRFGDIALGMTRRYGKILDAVASGKVKAYGEVSPAQMREFHDGAVHEVTHDPAYRNVQDKDQAVRDIVNQKVEAQQSTEGRTLALDGEGYDYALTALASQYPYWLHYSGSRQPGQGNKPAAGPGGRPAPAGVPTTGWSKPHDPRFHDTTEMPGGHLQRVGSQSERDSGYVKAHHIKSADALVGYFDPTIQGTARQITSPRGAGERPSPIEGMKSGQTALTGKGKVRGDVAMYQNWRSNPYNTQTSSQNRQGSGDYRDRESDKPQGNNIGGTATQQGVSGRNGRAIDRPAANNKQVDDIHAKIKEISQRPDGFQGKNWMSQYTNRNSLNEMWDKWDEAQRDKFINQVNEQAAKHAGMTGLDVRQHSDETQDSVMRQAETNMDYNTMVGIVNSDPAEETRQHLRQTALKMAQSDDDAQANAASDLNALPEGDKSAHYEPYLYVEKEALLNEAYPHPGDDRKFASILMDVEGDLYTHEQTNDKLDDEGHGEAWANFARRYPNHPAVTGSASATPAETEAAQPEIGRQEQATPSGSRHQMWNDVYAALDEHQSDHNSAEPSEADFADAENPYQEYKLAHHDWAKKNQMLTDALEKAGDYSEADLGTHHKATGKLRALLEQYPEVGEHPVGTTNVAEMHRRLSEMSKSYQPRLFSISKRAGLYHLRRVA